jgi:hypothetical protein
MHIRTPKITGVKIATPDSVKRTAIGESLILGGFGGSGGRSDDIVGNFQEIFDNVIVNVHVVVDQRLSEMGQDFVFTS